MHFDENPFTCQCKKEKKEKRKKGLRVSNFALLLVVYKWHAGSERVKGLQSSEWLLTGSEVPFWRVAKGLLVICRCKGSYSTHWLFIGREISMKGVPKYSLIVHWQRSVIERGRKVLTDCSLAEKCHWKQLWNTHWQFSWQWCAILTGCKVLADCWLAVLCHCKASRSTHWLLIRSDVSL